MALHHNQTASQADEVAAMYSAFEVDKDTTSRLTTSLNSMKSHQTQG